MAKVEKPKPIDLRQRIKVRITEKNPYGKYGDILEVHPIVAVEGNNAGYFEIVKDEKKK